MRSWSPDDLRRQRLPFPAAARGHHHGRQRPVGEAAGPSARGGPPDGGPRRARRRGVRPRTAHLLPHPLRFLPRELGTPGARGPHPHDPPAGIPRERASPAPAPPDPAPRLPALAIRLRRVRLHGRPVARLRQGRVPPGAGGVLPPPPALRADRRAGRTAPPEVAMLLQRIATAVVLIPLLVASILSSGGRPGGWPFLLLCGVAAALCAHEWFRLFFRGTRGRAGGVALVLLVFLSVSLCPGVFGVPAVLLCVLLAVFHALPGSADPAEKARTAAMLCLGAVYVGGLLATYPRTLFLPRGGHWVLMGILAVAAGGATAHLTGRGVGR